MNLPEAIEIIDELLEPLKEMQDEDEFEDLITKGEELKLYLNSLLSDI